MPEKSPHPHIHWLYLWLAISATGNLIGMASLVEGLVTWADFFKHIIELYRDNIRWPIAWVGNHLWPFGKLPGWVFDVLIAYSVVYVASNMVLIRKTGHSFFYRAYNDVLKDNDPVEILLWIIWLLIWPLMVPLLVAGYYIAMKPDERDHRLASRDILLYAAFVVVIFVIILFVNYQILRLHAPH